VKITLIDDTMSPFTQKGHHGLLWSAFLQIFTVLFQFITLCLQSDHEKEVEILLLRRQLAILHRQNQQVVRPQRDDKFVLATLAHHLKDLTNRTTVQLQSIVSIVRPETILRWHREIVQRKWTFTTIPSRGRPVIEAEVETLIIRFARENDWGYGKIVGELRKLRFHISKQSVANILKQNGILPYLSVSYPLAGNIS
jgi:putative transposase